MLQLLHTKTTFNETIQKLKESLRSERYSYLAEMLRIKYLPVKKEDFTSLVFFNTFSPYQVCLKN